MGDTKGGKFEADFAELVWMLAEPNPGGLPNSDVLRPWYNTENLTKSRREVLIVDFGIDLSEGEASLYEAPFSFIKKNVQEIREDNPRPAYKSRWWKHVEARPGLRSALQGLDRSLVTPTVSKHRLFAWLKAPTLPDHQLIVFPRSDDYFFGVLHSRLHEPFSLFLFPSPPQSRNLPSRPPRKSSTSFVPVG